MSVDCLGTINWTATFLNEKQLNVIKELAYRKIIRCIISDQIRYLGR